MKKKFLLALFFMGTLSATVAQNLNPILQEMSDGEWQSAYDDLERIMERDTANLEAKFYSGICLTELYRAEEAVELFEQSADLAEDIPMFNVFFAEAYIRVGEIQNAKNVFGKVDIGGVEPEDMLQFIRVRTNINAGERYLLNPDDIIVQNMGSNINTDGAEYSPVMTFDHRSVFFTTRRNAEPEKPGDGIVYEQVMSTNMDEFDDWEQSTVLEGYNTGNHHDATIQLMNNDSTMVTYKDEDLFISNLGSDGNWGEQRGIRNINTNKWESHVYFYNQGNSIIYASAANTKNGKLDLFIAHKKASGKWSKGTPINELNSDENDDSPYVAGDGTLYFASRGHDAIGGYDIFKSKYDSTTNKFSTPENLGMPINSGDNDTFFSVYGKMAYLASHRPGGYGTMDIYKVYLFNKTVVAGSLLNCDGNSPLVGVTVSVEGQEEEFSAITDENGFYKMEMPIERDFFLNVVMAGNNIYRQKHYVKILFRDETDVRKDFLIGCPDQEGSDKRIIIKLKNSFDLNPSAIVVEPPLPPQVKEEPEVVVKEEIKADEPDKVIATMTMPTLDEIRLSAVYFDFAKHDIKEEFYQRLNAIARLLKDRTDLRVLISGHTDNYGTNAYNVALGKRRYNEVHSYLVDKGVDPAQLKSSTYGEELPQGDNRTTQGRALNRRVNLSFIQ